MADRTRDENVVQAIADELGPAGLMLTRSRDVAERIYDVAVDAGMGPVGLQGRVADWHTERFPAAQPYHVALKAMEELGELAEALNGHLSGGRDNEATSRRGDVPDEAADVAVCLMVLLGRWFPDGDLLERVESKLAMLSDPNSGHRSALSAASG